MRVKKGVIFLATAVFAFVIGEPFVFAFSSLGGFFGGRIISVPAMEIQLKEWAGFTCFVYGTSITITPLGSPAGTPISYFIPWAVTSATGFPASPNQLVLGIYSGEKTPITCILPSTPPVIDIVELDTITYFGNSQY